MARTTAVMRQETAQRTPAAIIGGGIAAGIVAGIAMAMWIMLATATYRDLGALTPLYAIAAPFEGVDEVRQSMAAAATGDMFWWSTAAALLGAAIHMGWSMFFGVVFAAVASAGRLFGAASVLAGLVYGLVLMVVMSWITLPLTQAIFGGEPFVAEMPERIGWATWTIGHLIYGLVVGLWFSRHPRRSTVA